MSVKKFHDAIACGEVGPAVRPRNVRKMTVMSGNQEDRGREQLDQVSPLYIDSFFPFMCVSLSQRFQFLKHLNLFDKLLSGEDAIRQMRGIKRTGCAMSFFV